MYVLYMVLICDTFSLLVQRFLSVTTASWLSSARITRWGWWWSDLRFLWQQVCECVIIHSFIHFLKHCLPRSPGLIFFLQVSSTTCRRPACPASAPPPKLPSWRPAKASPRPSWSATASRRPVTAPSPTPRRPATTSARQCSPTRASVCTLAVNSLETYF